MKKFTLIVFFALFTGLYSFAQTTHSVTGVIMDSTKTTLPGSQVSMKTDQGDSTNTVTDVNGKFTFPSVNAAKITLTIRSLGYQSLRRHYNLDQPGAINLGNIILKIEGRELKGVTIVGVNAVRITEDTVEYKVSQYNVRQNAPIEDALKKMPGVDVDPSTGAVTAHGQQVAKVRLNGKDYNGGDVASLTRNLPADLVDNIQIVDDYGDQANLTGIKTGEPQKVLNINIRKDKNYGFSLQATAGDGEDLLPANQASGANSDLNLPTQKDANRYLGTLNLFKFKGDQQIAIQGNLNNTNVNTFSFGGGGGFGGGGFGGGGGGGRGNAARGGGGGGSTTSNQNGITNARAIGGNYRDSWGKYITAYGSYNFADNTTNTASNSIQDNTNPKNPSSTTQFSNETDGNINHRFNFNIEYKPDTINYLKITPSYTYSKTTTYETDSVHNVQGLDNLTTTYRSTTTAHSSTPTYGLAVLFNHRFNGHGRNFSIYANASSSSTNQFQNPIYDFIEGKATTFPVQYITTNSKTSSLSSTLSYIEPLGKTTYLELNYSYNRSYSSSNKVDNAADTTQMGNPIEYVPYLSNDYHFTFTTNRGGLSFRQIEKKYNYTLGIGVQPATLDGYSPTTGVPTHQSTVNFAPTARFVYNFARSNSFSFNYNGNNDQPSFSELQPVIDYSNALYPVQGNPDLKPSFTNNFSMRYNKFSFQTGNVFFSRLSFTQTENKVVTQVITYPKFSDAVLATLPASQATDLKRLEGTNLTQYVNANGYYNGNLNMFWAKPWDNRKYTLYLIGNATYANNVGFVGSVDANDPSNITIDRNIAKTFTLAPQTRFRVDIADIVDAQAGTSYSISNTNNSIKNPLTQAAANVRTWGITVNGKNYLWKDWTLSYDYTHNTYYGYTVPIKNPNLLNAYLERRFLKNNAATIRAGIFDIFNQNTGYTYTSNGTSTTESNVNRLGRYYMVSFTLRLQKFAGRSPFQNGDRERGRFRDGGGHDGHDGPGGPPPGGPGL